MQNDLPGPEHRTSATLHPDYPLALAAVDLARAAGARGNRHAAREWLRVADKLTGGILADLRTGRLA